MKFLILYQKKNLKVKDYKNKLFELSYKLFLSENTKKCEKCKEEMEHNLVCANSPEFLLINCVWKESNPIVDDVISLFFLMSLKDELNNLFTCSNKRTSKKNSYYLFGFILYSFTLSHYIICIYNFDKKVFALFDDEVVKEFRNLYELIQEITVNVLKMNDKAFFYPVMLIFTQDNIYDFRDIRSNFLNDSDYSLLINKCNEAIYENQIQNNIKEEEKLNNYNDLIEKQKEIENRIHRRNKYNRNENKNNEEIEYNENDINNKNNKINNNENGIKNNYKKEKEKNLENQYNSEKVKEINNMKRDRNYYKNLKANEGIKDINIEYEENNKKNNTLKQGLNNINKSKITEILKDINKAKGENMKNDLYLGNFRDMDKIYNRSTLQNPNKNINNHFNEINGENNLNNGQNETKKRYSHYNYREKYRFSEKPKNYQNNEENQEENENKRIYNKKIINPTDNSNNYYYNSKYQRKTDNNYNNQDNQKIPLDNKKNNNNNQDNQKIPLDNKKNNNNENNLKDSNSKRIRGKNSYNSNIQYRNKYNTNNNEEKINAYKQNKLRDNKDEIINNNSKRNVYYEKEYLSNEPKKSSWQTPKKDRYHSYIFQNTNNSNHNKNNINHKDIENDQYNKGKLLTYKSEKKSNLFKSQFYENQTKKDENQNNYDNNNDELNEIQKNIRRKYYTRK